MLVLDGLVKLRGLNDAEFFQSQVEATRRTRSAKTEPGALAAMQRQRQFRNEVQSAGSDAAKTHTIHLKM